MKHTHIHTLSVLAIASLLAGAVSLSEPLSAQTPAVASVSTSDALTNVAERLQGRIERRFQKSYTVASLRSALSVRRQTFAHTVTVALQDDKTGIGVSSWTVSLNRYPEWMVFEHGATPRFVLDEDVIAAFLAENAPDGITTPSFATASGTYNDGKVERVTVEGMVQDGQSYDATRLAEAIVVAFERGHDVTVFPVESVKGAVLYDDGSRTLVLHELGVGRSVFNTSPWGRKQNVRKAMNEKANGVVIPQGSTFSYNATLGGPVTYSNGWYDSLIIVDGSKLEPAPGGGICQSATTVYRAAMAAGLPIVTRKSHSLYVTYYKQYGMGMDATVFPGKQDLRFENDTQGPIILLGNTDEHDNAYSMIYGIDDGREVALEGPFFGYTYKDPVMGRTLRGSEVAWIQRVTRSDGTVREQLQVSQYGKLPKSVALEFEPVMHGAADLVADAR